MSDIDKQAINRPRYLEVRTVLHAFPHGAAVRSSARFGKTAIVLRRARRSFSAFDSPGRLLGILLNFIFIQNAVSITVTIA